MQKTILLLLILVLSGACNDPKREEQLDKREKDLIQREEEFAAKAADYRSLLVMRDSLLSKKDSVKLQSWPEGISGRWKGRTQCQESDCTDYVVGDQRSDTWEFDDDSTGIFTRIVNNSKLLRIYRAKADSTEFRLHFNTDSAASRKVEINVILTAVTTNLIKGMQTINVNNKCTARFSVELVRESNK